MDHGSQPVARQTLSHLETVRTAARRAGVNRSYIYKLIQLNVLNAFEIDGKLFVRSADIDAYILRKSHRVS